MPSKEKTLDDLFLHTLKDIYYAEKQILKALPKMAKNAEFRRASSSIREPSVIKRKRRSTASEQVFKMIGKPAPGRCLRGDQRHYRRRAREIMEDFADSPALDAGILAAAQAVEHYEITRYGSLKTWAGELGLTDAVRLLDQTLQEEKETDVLLTRLAQARVNTKAA